MAGPAKYDIHAYQGDTFILAFKLGGNYAADTHKLQVRTVPAAGTAAITLQTNSGITAAYVSADDKTSFTATIPGASMAALNYEIIYSYDFQITNASTGYITTFFGGNFTLDAETTR